jgi:hypothetical protein
MMDGTCWPGTPFTVRSTLRMTTLRVGPAVIQGGSVEGGLASAVAVDRLVVDAGTSTVLAFTGAGTFVAFQTIEVSRELWYLRL